MESDEEFIKVSDKKLSRIEKIANNFNNSDGRFKTLKKIVWGIPYIIVVGSSPHGVQKWAWDKFKLFTPRTSTNSNTIGFGLIGLGIQSYLMQEAGDAVIPDNVSNWVNIAYNTSVWGYYGIVGVAQSAIRLGYTNTNWFKRKGKEDRKGKGAWSISGTTLIWNTPYFIGWATKKGYDFLKRGKQGK